MAKDESAATTVAVPLKEQIATALAAVIEGKPLPQVIRGGEAHRDILERLASAETIEELFTNRKLESWGELEGVPVEVLAVHLNPSSFEEGRSAYAVVNLVTLDDGENLVVATGARNVMVQLLKSIELGSIPGLRCRYVKQRTGEGYTAGWLELVEGDGSAS